MAPYLIGLVNETYDGIVNIEQLNSGRPGAAVDLLNLVCHQLKIFCQFQVSEKSGYGARYNGNWSGVLGEVLASRYNSAAPVFSLTSDLVEDFYAPSVPLRIPLYWATRKSEKIETFSLRALTRPLSWRVWLVILFTLVLLSFIIVISQAIRPVTRRATMRLHPILAFTTVFVNIAVYLVRKGPVMRNLALSSKILQLFWGICALLMIASYTGGLLSSMFKMESKPPFQDMPTLIDCLNAQLCRMVFSPKDEWFLREMDDKSSRYSALKIPLQRNPPIDVATEEDRLELVEHHKDVFIVTVPDAIGGFLSLMKDRCAIALIKDQWDDVVSMPFHKNDEYGEKFNRELLTLEELGITKKIIAQYTINNDCASLGRVRKPTAPPVPLRLALGAIIILACGCLFALLTLGTENFSYYCLPKRL